MAATPNSNGATFVSIAAASLLTGYSQQALRRLSPSELPVYRRPGSLHRRYSVAHLQQFLHGGDESLATPEYEQKIAIYVRVSSSSQKDALQTQKERVITEVCKRENITREKIVVYECINSSFSANNTLMRMLWAVEQGTIEKIYVELKNRLFRIEAVEAIVRAICDKHKTDIVFLWDEIDRTDDEILVAQVLDYLTVITNRASAKKAKMINTYIVNEEVRQRVFDMLNQKVPTIQIHRILRDENVMMKNGNNKEIVISHGMVRKIACSIAYKLLDDNKKQENSVDVFVKMLRKNKNNKIMFRVLYDKYVKFCEANDLLVLSAKVFSLILRQQKWILWRRLHDGLFFVGLELVE